MNATPTLKDFYTAVQEWIDAGMPEDNPHKFDSRVGLCSNLIDYLFSIGIEPGSEIAIELDKDLYWSFKSSNLDAIYPFNSAPDSVHYAYENSKYTNPKRLAWIKAQLAVL